MSKGIIIIMHIAVCDDDKITRELVCEKLCDYAEKSSVKITYEAFESYADISDRTDEFDIFLLDYKMDDVSGNENETDGMQFARLLRQKHGAEKNIIFITAYDEFVYEAFEVRAHRFLKKPINREKLFEALDECINTNALNGTVVIKINDEAQVFRADEIYYLEVSLKNTFVHTKQDTFKCHKTIASFEDELAPLHFFRIHRSFIVNLAHVKSYNSKYATLDNGVKLFISPKKYSPFCEAMLKKPFKPSICCKPPHNNETDEDNNK